MTGGPVGREMVRRVEDADKAMKHYLASYDIVEEATGEPWRPAQHSMAPYLTHPGLASLNDRPEEAR